MAFSFGKGAFSEVAKFKNEDGIILELITIDSLVPMAKKPNVKLVVELLEKKEKSENYKFEIKATAGDGSQIEFYSFENQYFSDSLIVKRETKEIPKVTKDKIVNNSFTKYFTRF